MSDRKNLRWFKSPGDINTRWFDGHSRPKDQPLGEHDIIYINDAMEVVSIQKNAQPLNESSLPSEGPASLVLEIKGGLSDRWGIEKGQKIRWKRLD